MRACDASIPYAIGMAETIFLRTLDTNIPTCIMDDNKQPDRKGQMKPNTPAEYLTAHIRRELSHLPAEVLAMAIAEAQSVYGDGAVSMQIALDHAHTFAVAAGWRIAA